MEVSSQLHAPSALPPKGQNGTHWTGRWVVPRAGLDVSEKKNPLYLPRFEPLTAHTVASRYIPTTLPRLQLKICDHKKKISLGQSCSLATSYWAPCIQMAFFTVDKSLQTLLQRYIEVRRFHKYLNANITVCVYPHAFQAIISQRTHVNCQWSMKCNSPCLK
jgi:hypothetical protein